MPVRRTLSGIALASSVTVGLLQGGISTQASTGPEGWGVIPATGNLTISITKKNPSNMRVPCGVTYVAEVEEDLDFAPDTGAFSAETDTKKLLPEYYWFVSGGTHGAFTAPDRVPNPELARGDRGIGSHFSPTFIENGTHQVTCYAYYPNGDWGVGTVSSVTESAVLGYSSANTVCLDETGLFSGAPAAAAENRVTTIQAASARVTALVNSGQTDVRVLVNPNSTLNVVGNTNFNFSLPTLAHFRMEAWGPGPITFDMPDESGTCYDLKNATGLQSFKVQDIKFQGAYDAQLEVGNRPNFVFSQGNDVRTDIVFNNTADFGIKTFLGCGNGNAKGSLHVVNHDSRGANDYFGVWPANDGIVSITGCAILPIPLQAGGSRPKNGFGVGSTREGNVHGGFRGSGEHLYFVGNQVALWQDWTDFTISSNNGLRLFRNNPVPASAIIAGNLLETAMEVQEGNNGDITARHVVCERNMFVPNEQFPSCFVSKSGCTTFRNNIIIKFNLPSTGSAGWTGVMGGSAVRLRPGGENDPWFTYGNTLVDLSNDANRVKQVDFVNTSGWNHVFDENNLKHEPNMTGGVAQNLDTTPLAFDPTYPGLNVNYVRRNRTITAAVAPNASFEIPYADLAIAGYPMAQSDFSGVGFHTDPVRHVVLTEAFHQTSGGLVSVDITDPDFIVVTNNTGYAWPMWTRLRIETHNENTSILMDPDVGTYSEVPDGGTISIPNPTGSDRLTIDGTGAMVEVNLDWRFSQGINNGLSAVATATGVQITNTSTHTMAPSDYMVVIIDTGDNQFGPIAGTEHPAGGLSLYRPNAAIPATAGLIPLHDFLGNPRVGTPHPQAVAGTATMGAVDVAA